ncbi:uncharacterized protein N7518_009811 [Penicillium psychrosexuale]|uniref:uncharacterized protein n=1 Tax=Penicillium psychrosexuale TaxID=1002107 RepID=UPI0025456771|nr:uncharacterized protein N7518_009811 [Penicillium psychrosexuale]KAJ5784134.1 hypothetical protein N7518_009811 [Penicillium psychrosexuale]
MACGKYRVLSLGVGLNLAPYSMTQYITHNKMPKHPDLQAVDCYGYVHAEGTIKFEQDLHVLREKPLSTDIKSCIFFLFEITTNVDEYLLKCKAVV